MEILASAKFDNDARVEFRVGSKSGELVASVDVPQTGHWGSFETVAAQLGGDGTDDLFLVFRGGAGDLLNLDAFELR